MIASAGRVATTLPQHRPTRYASRDLVGSAGCHPLSASVDGRGAAARRGELTTRPRTTVLSQLFPWPRAWPGRTPPSSLDELAAQIRCKSYAQIPTSMYHQNLARTTERPTPGRSPGGGGRELRVAVVEEHEILRSGLVACLEDSPWVHVGAASADDLDQQDVDLAVVSSEAARSQAFPCPIVICSDYPEGPPTVAEGNDVVGLVHRESVTIAQLHATIQAAAAGLRVRPNVAGGQDADLDRRSLRLMELLAEGHSTREVAARMSYSEQTIKKLIHGLEDRLEARSRAHLVALAIRRGLI
jgi:DNA-binding NarL/FixJ family response regulator